MLQNAPATDVLLAKQELGAAAIEPLKRQVIQDIAQSRFNVGHDGLGGYSDSYLKALFSPEEVKELYLKGDLANRLKFDPNPSGTAGGLQSLDQLKFGNQSKMTLAAKLSMPKDALSYLSDNSTASNPGRTQITPPLKLATPAVTSSAVSGGWAQDTLAKQAGLVDKGEAVKGSGVLQFEDPTQPGKTVALNSLKIKQLGTAQAIGDYVRSEVAKKASAPTSSQLLARMKSKP
jgi:hypothetical protein